MKRTTTTLIFCLLFFKATFAQEIVTADIGNFWNAYDKITATKDSTQQFAYLNQLFIDKGTPGLKAMMQARDYTAKSYIDAINGYPLFWNSIRANTFRANEFSKDIAANVSKLKKLYPGLKPAKIYFTIGAFKSGGTTMDNMVLIGSEIALGDEHTVMQEFPKNYDALRTYFKTNPINLVVFTNIHEYIHTQQKTTAVNCLLAQCVLEGVAEYLAVKATGQPSTAPAIAYGKAHNERIREVFASQIFSPNDGFWLYSNAENEFGVRDLGYYVGYAICEDYYNKAKNKQQAIKEMIELDYNNETALSQFVDQSGYFSQPVQALKTEYEKNRPVVTGIKPFKNNATDVSPADTRITVEFSATMDKHNRNFELGPLGKSNLLVIKKIIGFAEDGKSITFEVELKPAQRYQVVVGEGFRNADGVPIKPYLIDFTTTYK
ncbi:MAG TPA: Ig-like domain-containing protein [Mucilaginibacter sp.]